MTIERVELLGYAWPLLELEVACGGGTYIRSIARDVGDALGCGGLVEVLTRTRIGPFTREARRSTRSRLSAEAIPGLLLPAAEAVAALPRARISAGQVAEVAQGRALPREALADLPPGIAGEVALLGPDGVLVAVAEVEPGSGRVRPRRVLLAG